MTRGLSIGILASYVVLSGCAELTVAAQREPVPAAPPPVLNPELAAPPPPAAAQTVEQFDTTTEAQRIAAAAPSTGGVLLGEVVASLGDPGRPGFWIETDLVDVPGLGRLVYPVNGKSVEVELTPREGRGARVSLSALRLLEAPLTDLPTLEVYADR